jgi:ribonuclease P protein component
LSAVLGRAFFGRDRRLRKRGDFLRIQRDGRPVRAAHFVFLVAKNVGATPTTRSRMGIVAAKKTGAAPVRNRIKRLCRECFRLDAEFLPNGIDLVVIAKPGAGDLKLKDVQSEWSASKAKLHAQCEKVLGVRP